ncbi:hypothetical protein PL671_14440 [Phocaeicola vulgatus]|nr:hypothetical protein [Phocaeicola vulgatus]MDB0777759.1 hypothetical protein [Phocaeicola vulgatus]MDB0786258.1 hypothetical protein [Phocaeicola vulgatus]MDB0818620.1 hypothetical protein [Phocaeicola vulgatus]MDB0831343.1 hypothetical protein [Phocaeicola vulgatus]MDB0835619.1 hypothetical protein [Phocaeicola vulgatus]
MEQEHQLKSLLTEQQFEDTENKEFMLAQARAAQMVMLLQQKV